MEGDELRLAARVVHQVVEEELAGEEDRRLPVDRADPGRAVEGDHALPHVLLRQARYDGRVDDRLLGDVEEGDADVVDGLHAVHGLRVRLVRVVGRHADRVDVGGDVLGGEDALTHELAGECVVLVVLGEKTEGCEVGAVVTRPALVEVDEGELESEGRDRVVAHAHLAVVERVPIVVPLLEELGPVHEGRAFVQILVRTAGDFDRRGLARARNEGAVDRVGEGIVEAETPRARQEGLLRRCPVAGIPVPLEEVLRELPDVA